MKTLTESQPPAANQAAHVPTPYTYRRKGKRGKDGRTFIISSDYGPIAEVIVNDGPDSCYFPEDIMAREATAAFIVRCVNSHAALVAALEKCAAQVETTYGAFNQNTTKPLLPASILAQARAALASVQP